MLGNFALRASHGLVSILFLIPESGITDSLTLWTFTWYYLKLTVICSFVGCLLGHPCELLRKTGAPENGAASEPGIPVRADSWMHCERCTVLAYLHTELQTCASFQLNFSSVLCQIGGQLP